MENRPGDETDVPQFFSPTAAAGPRPLTPVVYGVANVRFVDKTLELDFSKLVTWTTPIGDAAVAVAWDAAQNADFAHEQIKQDAPDGAILAAVPAFAINAKNYEVWREEFVNAILQRESVEILKIDWSGDYSRPGESECEFRARLSQESLEGRDLDLEVDALRSKYAPRLNAVNEKLRIAQQRLALARQASEPTATSVRALLMQTLMGRKASPAEDILLLQDKVTSLQRQHKDLSDELRLEIAAVESPSYPNGETIERIMLRPKRKNVSVRLIALLWT